MSKDYIDDDRDVIAAKKPRLDVYAEVEKAVEREHGVKGEAGVTLATKHVEATTFWQRTKDGIQSWGARIRASWGGK